MRGAALVLAPLLLSGAPVADRCLALASLSTPALTIEATRDGPFCRATMVARPRPTARIGIELWLPPPEHWSGRYYQMGNGGFAGHIDAAALKAAAQRGDAAAATDTGHRSDGFDAHWAAGRRDLVKDYAYRSIKVTADAARVLVRAYYRRPARYRYFMACSFGGRQALVAATRWPADWDGIIAGAPALHWPDRLQGFARIQRALQAPGAAIPVGRLPMLIAAAGAQCAAAKAARCEIAALERGCRAGISVLCLSAPQRAALATIEAAGYRLTGADPAGWQQWMLQPDPATGSQLALADQGYRYVIGGGERWNVTHGSLRIPPAVRKTFAVGDLHRFARRGGRVISYFGLADPVLPSALARHDARSIAASDASYRLFLIPGMGHCQGGPSAAAFGQAISAPSQVDDPAHDIRRAIEAWTELGRAPKTIVVSMKAGDTQQVKNERL